MIMDKNKSVNYLDYISLMLILSFFLFHKIYLVLLGIIFSLYSINKYLVLDIINSFKIRKSKNKYNEEEITIIREQDKIELKNKESEINLVEKIEELGFIPSIDKNDDINAA